MKKQSQINQPYNLWKTAKFYMKLAFEYPFQATLGPLLTGIGTLFVMFIPALFVAQILNNLTDNSFTSDDLLKPVLFIGASMLIGETMWRIGIYFVNRLEANQMQALAMRTFSDLIKRSVSFHADRFAGSLVTRSSRLSKNFESFYDSLIFNVVDIFITVLFVGIILAPRAPFVYFSFFVIVGIYIAIVLPITKDRAKMNISRSQKESDETAALADALSNVATIKAFANEDKEIARFKKTTESLRIARLKTWDHQNLRIDSITAPFYIIINVVSIALAIIAYKKWGAPADIVFLSFSYFAMLSRNIWGLNRLWRSIEAQLSEAAETLNMLAEPQLVVDKEFVEKPHISRGDIRFENVSFAHKDSNNLLFNNLDLHIKPGERVGVVGRSGGGKTTITKLILRFIDVKGGQILIDHQNIQNLKQTDLRQYITYVPQEPMLFHRSLKENIGYGSPNDSKQEILAASKMAHAHEFIKDLPDGYETLVGERGVKLSGGQRQRVAIARAMLKNAPILILDEATSALDSESEVLIQDALWKLMENKTAIVIAHRLSTIQKMDRILVLDGGQIVEQGTHKELIRQNGVYSNLWSHQSGGFVTD